MIPDNGNRFWLTQRPGLSAVAERTVPTHVLFAKPVSTFAGHALLCRMATLDFFYDLASTYSYLAAMRIGPLAQAAGVTVRWRPFLLGPIFKAQGYDTSPFNVHPLKGRNMVRDCERQCAELGLPFRLPSPFPAMSLLAGRIAHVGLAEGWGEDFSRAVYHAEFGEGLNISEPAVIATIIGGLGHNAEAALARAQSAEIKNALRAATEDAEKRDIFGAPSFVTAGELFWGNDRLEQALSWAKRS
jgi:2-hydroxychromene-2-carboxylate isomerase